LHRYVDFIKPTWPQIAKHFKPNLVLFVPVIAISLYKTMDKIMIGMLASKTDVSYYEYTERIIMIPNTFVQALGTVMLPRMSNLAAKGKKRDQGRHLGRGDGILLRQADRQAARGADRHRKGGGYACQELSPGSERRGRAARGDSLGLGVYRNALRSGGCGGAAEHLCRQARRHAHL
ncbi:MAG: oligosaccharide flippase family protein, partial [Ruminococcus sp.]|nr:oligosaccharide flippase family protein [Ruminococcus sp.]